MLKEEFLPEQKYVIWVCSPNHHLTVVTRTHTESTAHVLKSDEMLWIPKVYSTWSINDSLYIHLYPCHHEPCMCPAAWAAKPQEMNLSAPNQNLTKRNDGKSNRSSYNRLAWVSAQTAGALVTLLLFYSVLLWSLVVNEGCLEETNDAFLAVGKMEQ